MKNSFLYTIISATILFDCDNKVDKVPTNIDHLVFTVPNLEKGINEMEMLFGVKPVIGGRHSQYGTHNALLSLGDSTYLEIIAPDPTLPAPERGKLLELNYQQKSKLATWVLRSEQIEHLHSKATEGGLSLGVVETGEREKPDGVILSWKLTDPYAMPFEGVIPFLINWGKTPHPAMTAPKAGELIEFKIEHPNPEEIKDNLKLLNVHVRVTKSDQAKIIAKIKTDNAIIILE